MNMFKDMDENQYWLTIWTMGFTAVMATIALVAYSSATKNAIMEKMVAQGHDPIELACLFNSSRDMQAPCLLIGQAQARILLESNNVPK